MRGAWAGIAGAGMVMALGGAGAPSAGALLQLAESYSCSPRRTCPEIASCEEANWLLDNCSWGGKLDRDKDGVPCESLC